MRDIDQALEDAIRTEERELLLRIGEEPGFLSQALSTFSGRTGWVSALMMVVQAVLFVAGVWTAWRFFQSTDTLSALRWGLPSAVLLLMSLMIKLAVWPTIQTNRLLLELKRVELLIVQGRGR